MNIKKFKKNTYFLVPFIDDLDKEQGSTVFYLEEPTYSLKNMSKNINVNKLTISENCYLSLIPNNIKFGIARCENNYLNIILNKNCKKHIEDITVKIMNYHLFQKFSKTNFSIEIKENDYFQIKESEYERLLKIVKEEDLNNLLASKNL